jgi:hypothetical protein
LKKKQQKKYDLEKLKRMQRNPKYKKIFQIDKITNRDSLEASNTNYDQEDYGDEEEN